MKISRNNPIIWLLLSYGLIAFQLILILRLTKYGFENSTEEIERTVVSLSWLYILVPCLMGIFINITGIYNIYKSTINAVFKWIVTLFIFVALSLNLLILYTYFVLNACW